MSVARIFRLFLFLTLFSCGSQSQKDESDLVQEANRFLKDYNLRFQNLNEAYQKALWNAKIAQPDSLQLFQSRKRLNSFLGNTGYTEKAVSLLKKRKELMPFQILQLQELLRKSVVYRKEEQKSVTQLHLLQQVSIRPQGFFRLGNRYYKNKSIDSLFRSTDSWRTREFLFEKVREMLAGNTTKLHHARNHRNRLAESAGYGNFLSFKASEYGISSREVLMQSTEVLNAIRPIMEELHTYMRYQSAERYRKEIPDLLPPSWQASFNSSSWHSPIGSKIYERIDDSLATKSLAWLQEQARLDFWQSKLSASSFYYAPTGFFFQNIDRASDVRVNVPLNKSVESYLSLVYVSAQAQYALDYANPDVPNVLRQPINQAMEIGIAKYASHVAFDSLKTLFAVEDSAINTTEYNQVLLAEALETIPKLAYYAGVVNQFEFAIYANLLDPVQFSYKWWELQEKYLGVATPSNLNATYCDALLEPSILKKPFDAYEQLYGILIYYDLLEKLNHENQADKLHRLMRFGKAFDWKDLYQENIGELPLPAIISKHFEPLLAYLKKENEGRKSTLPDWE